MARRSAVPADYALTDSGERKTTESGAQRERLEGKGRYDLISPIAMQRLAILLEKGAIKYSERNWEKGMPLSWYQDAALRHMNQLVEGYDDEDHAACAMFNIMAFMHTKEMIDRGVLDSSLDDTPKFR